MAQLQNKARREGFGFEKKLKWGLDLRGGESVERSERMEGLRRESVFCNEQFTLTAIVSLCSIHK